MEISEIEKDAEHFRILNLRVMQDGELIFSRDWEEEIRRNQYSVSKSFTSIAVGIACKEGLLSLEEHLTDAFPDEVPDNPSDFLKDACVRDLLTMCLGQDTPHLMGGERISLKENDWVRYALSQPFNDEPGSTFLYNNVGPYLAGVLIQRRAGCSLLNYLTPRLFKPLGIRTTVWEVDPMGMQFGASGLFLGISEVMKVAQMVLQKGNWEGMQLVPEKYIREATGKQVDNGNYGYGYLFWRGPYNSWRMDGKYGQFYIGLEEENAVIGINAESRCSAEMLNRCMDVIVPTLRQK